MTRPSSVPGRDEIARIIEPTAYHLRDELAKEESDGFPNRQNAELLAGKQIDVALAKADAILALVSNGTGEAGERAQDGAAQRERVLSELLDATEYLTWYSDEPDRPADKMTGVRMTFGVLRRIIKAHAALFALSVSVTAGREEIIEQCAKVADRQAETWAAAFGGGVHEHIAMSMQEECETIAKAIRALTGSSS